MRKNVVWFTALLASAALAGCSGEGITDDDAQDEDVDEIEAALAGFELTAEQTSLSRHNTHRHNHVGAVSLDMRTCLKSIARAWAKHIAEGGSLQHNPNLGNKVTNNCPWNWHGIGENIGVGPTEHGLFQAWLNSSPHHHNIDNKPYRYVGIGAYRKNGLLWMVVDFADPM